MTIGRPALAIWFSSVPARLRPCAFVKRQKSSVAIRPQAPRSRPTEAVQRCRPPERRRLRAG
eukprot:841816-Alexandrium_andersonii.AAC.1